MYVLRYNQINTFAKWLARAPPLEAFRPLRHRPARACSRLYLHMLNYISRILFVSFVPHLGRVSVLRVDIRALNACDRANSARKLIYFRCVCHQRGVATIDQNYHRHSLSRSAIFGFGRVTMLAHFQFVVPRVMLALMITLCLLTRGTINK